MTIPSTTSPSTWNRATKRINNTINTGAYVNAETTLLLSGPPRLSDLALGGPAFTAAFDAAIGDAKTSGAPGTGMDALFPIGQCEMFQLQQSQAVQKHFEIGSRRSYQAGGRVQVVGSLGAVLFKGPSLMRACYAYYPSTVHVANNRILGGPNGEHDSTHNAALGAEGNKYPEIFFEPGALSAPNEGDRPDSFFINLMSELFSHPFGICAIIRTNDNKSYGGFYLEDCMFTSHSFQISASSTLISEVVSFQCDAAVPVEFSTNGNSVASTNVPRAV